MTAAVDSTATALTQSIECPACTAAIPVGQGQHEAACGACRKAFTLSWAGEKCEGMAPVEVYRPYAGATTFDEIDAMMAAQDVVANVNDQKYQFDALFTNIWEADDLEPVEKISRMRAAVAELVARIESPPPMKGKGLLDRLREALGGGTSSYEKEGSAAGGIKAWDGAAAERRVRRWASSDGSGKADTMDWGKYGRAFAVKEGAGDKFGDFSFPHHDIVDGALTLDRGGVMAAWGAAQGARAGSPNTKAQRHLMPHRRSMGMEKEVTPLRGGEGAFKVFKDAGGALRWLAVVTNKFEDKDEELFSKAAHEEFEAYLDRTKDYPPLLLWHTKGTRIGTCDFWATAGGFVLASGTFDKGMAEASQRLADMAASLGISHGYSYDNDRFHDGVYDWYRTREISVLPRERASNIWTAFDVEALLKEAHMLPDKRAFLAGIIGEERTQHVEDMLGEWEKELEEGGVRYKDATAALADAIGGAPASDPLAEGEPPLKPAGDPPPATGEEDDAADDEDDAEGAKALAGLIEARIAPLETAIKALSEAVAASMKSIDERVAEAMRSTAVVTGSRPSGDDGTLLPDQKAVKRALGKQGLDEDGAAKRNPVDQYLDMMKVPVAASTE